MNIEFGYTMAFMTGIMGSLHCLGMCGGFASGCFAGYGWQSKLQPHLIYHTARIATYTLLAIGGTMLGKILIQNGIIGKWQGILMILSGCAVVAIGLWLSGLLPGGAPRRCRDDADNSHKVPLHTHPKRKNLLPLIAGVTNGLVPCSLLFSVAIKVIAGDGSPLHAGALMLCFGLGTIPSMLLITTTGAVIGESAKGILSRLTGIVVVLLGLWTIYEGVVFYDIMRGLAN